MIPTIPENAPGGSQQGDDDYQLKNKFHMLIGSICSARACRASQGAAVASKETVPHSEHGRHGVFTPRKISCIGMNSAATAKRMESCGRGFNSQIAGQAG
jgi:hypothetical protein